MDDRHIVELYWQRSETAIAETQTKYGKYCHYIAYNILSNDGDAEECVNDTYLKAWESMPPHRPTKLSTFLGKITRHLALNRRETKTAEKRGAGAVSVALDELSECIADNETGDPTDEIALKGALNRFLRALPEETMIVFLQRYWYFASVKEIAQNRGMSESNVKVMLHRARGKLKSFLEKEGIII
ncbi:MAG: RNA polymerase sigma factor [Clostridia bacterium]|nr:RNA polymerase sigma factor [Clostridia bacterium]MBQ8716960.1 RNA polymerase sigma factor [Clostridia bacterium]